MDALRRRPVVVVVVLEVEARRSRVGVSSADASGAVCRRDEGEMGVIGDESAVVEDLVMAMMADSK